VNDYDQNRRIGSSFREELFRAVCFFLIGFCLGIVIAVKDLSDRPRLENNEYYKR
jgi:hypothetical protein